MPNPKKQSVQVKGGYLENIHKPLFKLSKNQLREILDVNWYPRANNALYEQRMIWEYSYLAYKGIMLQQEINRKRRANAFGLYVNVPRTFMTIEGIRRNFNISKLKVHLDPVAGVPDVKRNSIGSFLNYDLKRGKTFNQVKDAGFYKLLYGNGFLYSFLSNRENKYGRIVGDINPKTGVIKNQIDKKKTSKYFGMVARAISPFKVFPDPDGVTLDYNDAGNRPCNYVLLRDVKHISAFRRDWSGIIPDSILNDVKPGGNDMTNYETVKDAIDNLFRAEYLRYPGTVGDIIGNIKSKVQYDRNEFVEERIWLGEDFLIVQAGLGLKFCLISPNPNPRKISNLTKLDDIRIPDEFWSMGEAEIIRYQQIEENRIHNSVLDTLHFAISSMVGLNTQYLEDKYDTQIYPQKVWKFKAMPGVKIDEMMQAFQPSSNGIAPALKFMDEVKKIGQSTTSITDFVTGASKSIANTATEASKLAGASNIAIADKVKEMAGGALSNVAKIFLSMYPIAYDGEELDGIFSKRKIKFVGKKLKDISETALVKIFKKFDPKNVIFADDVDIAEPQFNVTGDVSLNRNEKLNQWIAAIDFSKGINETAFETGDPRRIDIVKMGIMGMENFDVVGNPEEFLLTNQPTKLSQDIAGEAAKNIGGNENTGPGQGVGGGAPKKNKVTRVQPESSQIRQESQPNNRGKNKLSKKNQ